MENLKKEIIDLALENGFVSDLQAKIKTELEAQTALGYSDLKVEYDVSFMIFNGRKLQFTASIDNGFSKKTLSESVWFLAFVDFTFAKQKNQAGKKIQDLTEQVFVLPEIEKQKEEQMAKINHFLSGASYHYLPELYKAAEIADVEKSVIDAEVQRRKEKAEAEKAEKEAAEKEALKDAENWIKENGSELLKLRVKYGFNYINLCGIEHAKSIIARMPELEGFKPSANFWQEHSRVHESAKPSLSQLQALNMLAENHLIEEAILAYYDESDSTIPEYVVGKMKTVAPVEIWIFKKI